MKFDDRYWDPEAGIFNDEETVWERQVGDTFICYLITKAKKIDTSNIVNHIKDSVFKRVSCDYDIEVTKVSAFADEIVVGFVGSKEDVDEAVSLYDYAEITFKK